MPHLYLIPLDQPPAVVTQHQQLLTPDEMTRARRFRFDRDRERYVLGRGAVRRILGHWLQTPPQQLAMAYEPHDKPYLSDFPELAFNLSHCGGLGLLAVSENGPVGVDIEQVDRPLDDLEGLARMVFTPAEQAQLAQYRPQAQKLPFFAAWTRKEAYLKGIGKGLALPLQSFSVELDPELERPSITVPDWHLFSLRPTAETIAAVATSQMEPTPSMIMYNPKSITTNLPSEKKV